MAKNALVISGGGSKGAFAVGAIDYMMSVLGLRFDIVAGTSTGALISPLVITGDVAELRHVYTTVTSPDIILGRPVTQSFLQYNSIYDTTPLWNLINETITDTRWDIIRGSNKQMFICAINMQTSETVYYQTGPAASADPGIVVTRVDTKDHLARAILASASQPVFMPLVEMPVGPQGQYGDGGVRAVWPVDVVLDNGATDIYAVLLTPENETNNKQLDNIVDTLLRTIELLTGKITHDDLGRAVKVNGAVVYRKALASKLMNQFGMSFDQAAQFLSADLPPDPFAAKQLVNLHIIRPAQALEAVFDTTGLQFDPVKMAGMMQLGEEQARKALGNIA